MNQQLPGQRVTNFGADWTDGRRLEALVRALAPRAVPSDQHSAGQQPLQAVSDAMRNAKLLLKVDPVSGLCRPGVRDPAVPVSGLSCPGGWTQLSRWMISILHGTGLSFLFIYLLFMPLTTGRYTLYSEYRFYALLLGYG